MTSRRFGLETLQALPKVDLHRHLEGSLRPETLWEFHRRQKETLHGSFEALRLSCTIPSGAQPGFQAFLDRFAALRFKFGGVAELERIAAEAVADAAADGVVHLELRFSPVYAARRMQPTPAPGTMLSEPPSIAEVERATEAVVRGARAEAAARRISVGFIVSLGRNFGVAVNAPSTALLQRDIGASFAGVDLAGDESFPAAPFAGIFRDWRSAGRSVTIHAGEDPAGAGSANVREAIENLGADRIGHGVRVAEDPSLVALAADKNIAFEMCPTSNVQTGACNRLALHPAGKLLEAGLPVTLNTDDPAISQTTLSREYLRAARECGLSGSQLRKCAINAAQAAFLPQAEKTALVRRVTDAWDREMTHAE